RPAAAPPHSSTPPLHDALPICEAIASLPAAVNALQSSALLLKGRHRFTGPDGKLDGTVGHFHLQITASGLGNTDTNSEAELFQKDRKSTRLNSSHQIISYAVFC